MGQLQDLPTSMFVDWPLADIHLYMDASNQGLAVLDPSSRRYIQVQFDGEEQAMIAAGAAQCGFTINVREQLSVALAVTVWGKEWASRFAPAVGQVWCWVDNSTAVATTNKLTSRNSMTRTESGDRFREGDPPLPRALCTPARQAERRGRRGFSRVGASIR